ncbi:MAG: response regulator [Ruminiclostridium sp.]|nr:response regulator [Ruminiclostridium sp.]
MRSIQTKIIIVISTIILVVVVSFLITSTSNTNAILSSDSDNIMLSAADYYANKIDDNFRSTEQSVDTIYNYAIKRAQSYKNFLHDENQRDRYTYDISELGKSIAENTRGAMSVYQRYNPDDYGPTNGFWYTINLEDNTWRPSEPTDMSLYDKDDLEHVGWYYIPVEAGVPMWMEPYYNANLGVNMISYIIPHFYGNYTVGIIGMDISLDMLKEATADVTVYKSGHAFMMETNGNIIYHEAYPNGISFSELPDEDKTFFGDFLEIESNTVNIRRGRSGTMEKLVLKELKNGMILGLYAPITEINEPQTTLMLQQLLISFIILVLAILVGLIVVRSITDPLKKMTAVAEQYANGSFNEEISVSGKDEVGILSRSLQTMSTSLKQQIEIADSANKAKSEFLASMSHEIRTPINAVLGMNEMILREAKDKEILDYSINIQDAGRNLLSLINTILDFSKIEDGKMEIIPISYDLASLVHRLVNSISERARSKGLTLDVNVDGNLPSVLLGDDMRISQVIMNLLTNAVKYTKVGGVTLTIGDGGRDDDTVILDVSVKDTGIGIREEDMDKLGVAFERLEEKRNKSIEGTGLGMSIVTRLLKMMDSELKIESVYGEGSTFSFRLPQKIDDERPIGNYAERVKANNRLSLNALPHISNAKVLVVDDYAMNLKVASNLLKLFGIEPELVKSGQEAIEAVSKKTYHIIFLDHMMPGMDGIETLTILREKRMIGRFTAVIALTANAIVGARETYIAAGFDDYLTKPIEMSDLQELLLKYLPKSFISYAEEGTEPVAAEEPEIVEDISKREAELLEKAGISMKDGMEYCADDIDFYNDVLKNYTDTFAEKCESLEKARAGSDTEAYRITIHALKSGSKTVGATKAAELAKELEDAAKSGDMEFINAHHEEFTELYRSTVNSVKEILDSFK